MLKQVSIYAENRKGTMQKITSVLLKENINILGSVTNDSAEYGIIRMIVSNPEKAPNKEKCGVQIWAGMNSASGQLSKVISNKSLQSSPKIGRPSE